MLQRKDAKILRPFAENSLRWFIRSAHKRQNAQNWAILDEALAIARGEEAFGGRASRAWGASDGA